MTCKPYEKDLLLLAHGQLNANDAARIRKHISTCALCGERFTQLAGVSLLLADAVHFGPPVSFTSTASHSSFLPAKQQWLLSAFLGGCILFALLSLMKTAQSYAAPLPSVARILPFSSAAAPPTCVTTPPCDEPKGVPTTPHKYRNAAKPQRGTPTLPASKY